MGVMVMAFDVQVRLPGSIRQGSVVEVKVKIGHPSKTGLTLVEDAQTKYERFKRMEPALYIREIQVFYGSEQIALFEINSATSDDPIIGFKVRADRQAPIRVVATNNRREASEGSAEIKFA